MKKLTGRIEMPRQRISHTKEEITQKAKDKGLIHGNKIIIPCGKCNGSGKLPHYMHVLEGVCFCCRGSGVSYINSIEKYVKREQAKDRRKFHIKEHNKRASEQCEIKLEIKRNRLRNLDLRLVPLIQVMEICWNNIVSDGQVPKSPINPVRDHKYFAWSLIEQWVEKGTLSEKQWEAVLNLIEKFKNPDPVSTYQGQIKERFHIDVTIQSISRFRVDDFYRYREITKTIVRFVDENHNVYVW